LRYSHAGQSVTCLWLGQCGVDTKNGGLVHSTL